MQSHFIMPVFNAVILNANFKLLQRFFLNLLLTVYYLHLFHKSYENYYIKNFTSKFKSLAAQKILVDLPIP